MTKAAREVLDDCRVALAMLDGEANAQRWRVEWAASVALLRAVGHVLHKVDGRDPCILRAAQKAVEGWRAPGNRHQIFRDFIERERNNLLKVYTTGVHPRDSVQVIVAADQTSTSDGNPIGGCDRVFELDENLYRPMVDGPWEGEDARDVVLAAIEWWERELDSIDAETRLSR